MVTGGPCGSGGSCWFFRSFWSGWSGGLGESAWLGGSGWYGLHCRAKSSYFLLFDLIQRYFQIEILSLMIQKNLTIISNGSMDFKDLMKFVDPQVYFDPNGILIGSMDFDNQKVYSDTSIFDGLVFLIHRQMMWSMMFQSV